MILVGVGLVVVVVVVVLLWSYRRVEPGQALLVMGYGGTRLVTEGGAFVWPVVHAAWRLPLDPWSVEVRVPDALAVAEVPPLPTAEGSGVRVEAVVRARIAPEVGRLRGTGGAFLTSPAEYQEAVLRRAIAEALALVVATATVAELATEPDEVAARVQASLAEELGRLGLAVEGVHVLEVKFEGEALAIADRI